MNLTADQAKMIADYPLADYDQEQAATKRVIGAVPGSGGVAAPAGLTFTRR